MKKNLYQFLFLFLFISAKSSQGQTNPGGIAAGNTLWLRADAGVTLSGGTVSQWQNIVPANVTGDFTVQTLMGTPATQVQPGFLPTFGNFNPYVYFNGVDASLTSVNSFPGTSLVSNSNVTVFQVFLLKSGVVWLKWETDQLGTTARLGFENSSGNIRFDYPSAVPASAGQNVGVINVINKYSLSTSYANPTASVIRLNGADNHTLPNPGPGNFSSSQKLCLGNEWLLNLPAQIYIAEVIIYSRTLTPAEINKVETYLAIKYGFTLDQTAAANDYTATDGTVIRGSVANTGYGNDITGIGRDDAENLLQKQSKSINTTSLVTIYNGTYGAGVFPTSNVNNTSTIAADKQFLLIGDNGDLTTLDPCIFNGKGQRMPRVWKVSNTNLTTPVTYSVSQAAVPSSVKNIIVSADPTFPPASTTMHTLTATGGKLYTDLVLNNNDYFTYASDTILMSPVVTPPTCSNPNSGSVVTNITGGNPPLTYLWQPSGQTSPDLTNAPAQTYTLTVTQGGCQADFSFTINPNPAPAAPTVNNVSVCNGNTATLTVQSPNAAYTYNWYSVPAGGTALGSGTTFTTPAITVSPTTFYVDATSGACTGPRTAVNVTITPVTAPIVNNESICSGTSAVLTVQNPQPGYTYNWYSVSTGGTVLGSGTTFTTPVLTGPATYYAEAINAGCTVPRTPVNVTTTGIPAPVVNGTNVCSGSSAALSVQSPNASYTYNWYAVSTGGTALSTGTVFNTPALTATTTYYAEATGGSCTSPRTPVTVTVTTIPAPVADPAAVCNGNTATLTIQSPNILYTYHWYNASSGGTPVFSGISFTTGAITAATVFYAEATDGVCNSPRTPVTVSLLPALTAPFVHVSSATISSVTFAWGVVTGAADYEISINGGVPFQVPSTVLTYTVTGLQPSQAVNISVKAISGPGGCGNSNAGSAKGNSYSDGFFIPTTFTPNGDLHNDILIPHIPGDAMLLYFKVYNRWGQEVFTTTERGAGWNGKWSGKDQPNGVYVWICSYQRGSDAAVVNRGSVMIVR